MKKMKYIGLILGIFINTLVFAQSSQIHIDLSTGVDENGNTLAPGTPDISWQAVNAFTYTPIACNNLGGGWRLPDVSSNCNARWITETVDHNQQPNGNTVGTFYFTTTFTLDTDCPIQNADLNIIIGGDNRVNGMQINGVSIPFGVTATYLSLQTKNIPVLSYLQPGLNTVRVSVNNQEGAYMGLYICGGIDISLQSLPVNAGVDQTICTGQSVELNAITASNINVSWSDGIIDGVPFTPSAGVHVYTVTNECGVTDEVTVTVKANPIANAGPDQIICAGECVKIGTGIIIKEDPKSKNIIGGLEEPLDPRIKLDPRLEEKQLLNYSWKVSGTTAVIGHNSYINVCPTTTTTYTLTVTNGSGCTATDQVTVTVNPIPAINAGNDQTICFGQSVTLTSIKTFGATVSWTGGIIDGVPFVPAVGTHIYTVTANLNGCTATDQVIVTVNQIPAVNAGPDQTICVGECVTIGTEIIIKDPHLGSLGGTTEEPIGGSGNPFLAGGNVYMPQKLKYQWTTSGVSYVLGTGTTMVVCPTATTTYTLTVTNAAGCTATDQVTVTVTPNDPSYSFGANTSNANYFTLSATANDVSAGSQAGFGFGWYISEMNGNTVVYNISNPSCWWYSLTTANQFAGFDAVTNNYTGTVTSLSSCSTPAQGKFKYNTTYRIMRGTWTNSCPFRGFTVEIRMNRAPGRKPELVVREIKDGEENNNVVEYSINSSVNADIYPNPSQGQFNIQLDKQVNDGYITIYDITGKEVKKSIITETNVSIDLSGYTKGMYMIIINADGNTLKKSIVIE